MMKNVYIIGSKGIPAKYGGFETFVENLTKLQKSSDIKYFVSCLNGSKSGTFQYNGATCFNISVPNIGPGKAILYDILSLRWAIQHIEQNNVQDAVVYILACRVGPFIEPYVKKLHQLGATYYLNPDGHEWLRAKWSKPVRAYWRKSEKKMVGAADLVICDSINIERYIRKNYDRNNLRTCFIPYGATVRNEIFKAKENQLEWFRRCGLHFDNYYLIVGRFVPENNYEVMIREFMKSNSTKPLVIVTNVEKNKFYKKLQKTTHFDDDPRIKFVGTVYDSELLALIREHAFAYIHGHSVGGTNPSLLEALALTRLNLLFDVGFNHEVGEDGAKYWSKKSGSLSNLINQVDNWTDLTINSIGNMAKQRIISEYNWDKIVKSYEEVFLGEQS
ncbi:beta 1-4 rhamnosyltransferase Cps2T [Lactiplantibacillus plantarum]|uniref:beta 1-4 rhamnosyltransferase Cps2T n=1 Tax=Lactiplantibacillus plantarum TaxID=1590 RepID=UPI0021824C5A|nr:DUF1972 domain-containing protein [Lactiplantibacillus plantarum]MDV3524448.1 DUF1972 domain-containing protein [Lactiplantibacillus plantarum]